MSADNALSERLNFMKLDGVAQAQIRQIKSHIDAALPKALDAFYDQLNQTPQTKTFFKDRQHMASAKTRQMGHWDSISSGRFDGDFVDAVTKVGNVHARIGLEPKWYIGGYALVLDNLIKEIVKARWPKGGIGLRGPKAEQVGSELGALSKATLLDMDLAISVYLEALEAQRVRAENERAAAAAEQTKMLRLLADGLSAVASGDLSTRITEALDGEHAQIKLDFNSAVAKLEEALAGVASSIDSLDGSAQEIASASDDLSKRTEQQAASLEQTAAALDQITTTVRRSAEGAAEATKVVADAKGEAERSGGIMRDAVNAMGEIEQSSHQISQIIGVIDEIAFQTNLLALNAGVEAARAGDAGRGFAVVASEVRALAQRSADAAKEIKSLIASSSSQVERGAKLVGVTQTALGSIVTKVAEINGLIVEISKSSQEQSAGLDQVNTAVNQMDQFTQQNAAMVEEATAAVSSLRAGSLNLRDQISFFKVSNHKPTDIHAHRLPASRATRPIQVPARAAQGQTLRRPQKVANGADAGWEEF